MLVAIVLLPTPPFALLTAMTLVTLAIGRFSGRPRFIRAAKLGGVPDRGKPWYALAAIQEINHTVFTVAQSSVGWVRSLLGALSLTNGFSWPLTLLLMEKLRFDRHASKT
jgi:hypothetical protein